MELNHYLWQDYGQGPDGSVTLNQRIHLPMQETWALSLGQDDPLE